MQHFLSGRMLARYGIGSAVVMVGLAMCRRRAFGLWRLCQTESGLARLLEGLLWARFRNKQASSFPLQLTSFPRPLVTASPVEDPQQGS